MSHLLEGTRLLCPIVQNWETHAEKYVGERTLRCLLVLIDAVVALNIVVVHERSEQLHVGYKLRMFPEHVGEVRHWIGI